MRTQFQILIVISYKIIHFAENFFFNKINLNASSIHIDFKKKFKKKKFCPPKKGVQYKRRNQ